MPKASYKYLTCSLLACHAFLFGQLQTNKYPVRFSQYYNCYSLINPAGASIDQNLEITVGDKHLLGSFNNISTYYVCANYQISTKNQRNNSPFSSIGVIALNDREGKYLNRSRFYIAYAWHGNITYKYRISGGFHLGAMNYSVKGTPLSGDGSDITPDGSVGLWIYNNKFHVGCSYNQIFNSKIQPLEEIAVLSPFLNFDAHVNFNLGKYFAASPSTSIRTTTNEKDFTGDISLKINYRNKMALVLGIHDNNRMINSFELSNVLNDSFPLNLFLTYGYPVSRQGIKTNFIEFGLSINQRKLN